MIPADAKIPGDAVITGLMVVRQDQRYAILVRQLLDRSAECLDVFCVNDLGDTFFGFRQYELECFFTRQFRHSLLTTQDIDTMIARNRGDPLPERLIAVVTAEFPVRPHKGFLGRVLCQRCGIQQPPAEPEYTNVILLVENLEGHAR